jgi:hypothetical protein
LLLKIFNRFNGNSVKICAVLNRNVHLLSIDWNLFHICCFRTWLSTNVLDIDHFMKCFFCRQHFRSYICVHCCNYVDIFWRMPSSWILCHVALVRTDVSGEPSASIIRVTRIGVLGTALAVTSNPCTLRRNTKSPPWKPQILTYCVYCL